MAKGKSKAPSNSRAATSSKKSAKPKSPPKVANNLRANSPKSTRVPKSKSPAKATKPPKSAAAKKVVLLSGGNPQIAKADGDAPVQAYIAAMPGWKSELGRRLDALITKNVPNIRKAVKWNSPFYGVEGQGWFLGFHVFTKFVKVTFFRGILLEPLPPGGTERSQESRWIDIREDEVLDEQQFTSWVRQAAEIPGWMM